MKCLNCGGDMELTNTTTLQDDYAHNDDLCFDIKEYWECPKCNLVKENLRSLK